MEESNKSEIYAARDRNGIPVLYVGEKPVKGSSFWHSQGNQTLLPKSMLEHVSWEDKSPTKVVIIDVESYRTLRRLAAISGSPDLNKAHLPDVP